MATSVEKLEKMDEFRNKYEFFSKKKISQNFFNNQTPFLPTWEYVEFLESALFLLEKKNIELKKIDKA